MKASEDEVFWVCCVLVLCQQRCLMKMVAIGPGNWYRNIGCQEVRFSFAKPAEDGKK